ncbi:phosphoenolpyruvate carboxykinase (ATP) [Lactiplantibacillus xiangfangensis]|uniref:phosphoenolpyruvate carboxykinase (ATP) n=1 Tax=Lactiplantibacillus xiangfangensis TaxID=942150 RepID=A0A0R2ML11_9LACO|nr:phosphoenolpyruvate carboxykinase (ATP) [Lactiplantibacillus xiangfangensis]KRO14388.1 phosphoenolpyruvate carboxykinase (atp) [Lactiplantibacillus xiangfangensis]
MSTKNSYPLADIGRSNPIFSQIRSTVETAFYGNNMTHITDVATAYKLATQDPGTVKTDLPIYRPTDLGLPEDAKMLVANTGKVVGRTAQARRILGNAGVDEADMAGRLRQAIYASRQQQFIKTDVFVGLDEDFIVQAHLAVPEGFANNLLSYMLNFQPLTAAYKKMFADSVAYPEGDIYIYADPTYHDPDYPDGLAIFDPKHNAAAILGMSYFGELKKSTLTLAWSIAHRHGYVSCHGGLKAFHFKDKQDQVFAMFGLSGSGKSTLTHAKHGYKYDITVLHDDAFVINRKTGRSVALEPSYFDKTNDYPMTSNETKYFMTVQNVGVTLDANNRKVLVTEDLRNGNGRTIKSRYASTNRVDKENAPINAIFWIMKDDSLPPVIKVDDPVLAATFGVTLATKRSTAENIIGDVDRDALVIEPFANPFRVYPLSEDYHDFKALLEEQHLDCYLLNTGFFGDKKIPKEITLGALEAIVNESTEWESFAGLDHMQNLKLADFPVDYDNRDYRKLVAARLAIRANFVDQYQHSNNDQLPHEITDVLMKLHKQLLQ